MSSDGTEIPDTDMRALVRDADARARDVAADGRDLVAETPSAWPDEPTETSLLRDRLLAARDRAAAALDRAEAALDRLDAHAYRAQSYRDGLTQALSRDAGREHLAAEISRAQRTGDPLVVAFLDVKGLKPVNDTFGHATGDHVLRSTGTALLAELRSYDLVVRYGGDEFVCALPGSDLTGVVERFQAVQARLTALCEAEPALANVDVGFRLGLAQAEPGDTLDDLVARADQDLYARRRQEGDRVVDITRAEVARR